MSLERLLDLECERHLSGCPDKLHACLLTRCMAPGAPGSDPSSGHRVTGCWKAEIMSISPTVCRPRQLHKVERWHVGDGAVRRTRSSTVIRAAASLNAWVWKSDLKFFFFVT